MGCSLLDVLSVRFKKVLIEEENWKKLIYFIDFFFC